MSLRQPPKPRVQPPAGLNISLNSVETDICELLDGCRREIRDSKGNETSCRIAGGWVRDKLLGSESNDIDVALSDMMGSEFAEELSAFACKKELRTGPVTKIKANPNQSKHLETAKLTIFGIEMDFVNLRSEEYADSRIPTEVAFGTPLEDALRRDTTINALFYNVHSRKVEDWTEKGLDDLQKGIIRTPMEPRETFLDDPLRVIRCIRFASRFGFNLVPELQEAAGEESIKNALINKISRERVGEEVAKILKGRDPLYAIQLVNELSLYDAIFHLPTTSLLKLSGPIGPQNASLSASTILQSLIYPTTDFPLPPLHPTLLTFVQSNASDRARLYLAASLTPYSGMTCNDVKKKSQMAVEVVIREGLSLGSQNHFNDGVPALYAASELLRDPLLEKFNAPSERVALGLLLRNKSIHNSHTGSHWSTSLLFSLVRQLVPFYDVVTDELKVDEATNIISMYNTFVQRVEEHDLPSAVDAKPILGGREVVQALGAKSPGVWTGQVLAKVVEWQLEFPQGTAAECEAWLRAEKDTGRISIEDVVVKGSKRVKMGNASQAKRVKKA